MGDEADVLVGAWGALLPGASTAGAVLDRLRSTAPGAASSPGFDWTDLAEFSGLPHRAARKVDRFSLLAVGTARAVLEQARIPPEARSEIGVITGNMLAGWSFTEPQLRLLHLQGIEQVSPYLATAWFPAAPQGQITIHLGLKGYSKTVTTDRRAGIQAIGLAWDRLATGCDSYLLAGGVEAPLTPLVQTAFDLAGLESASLGEGAAYLLLSSKPGFTPSIGLRDRRSLPPMRNPVEAWRREMREVLDELLTRSRGLLGVVADLPPSTLIEDEFLALLEYSGGGLRELLCPARVFGESLAASSALAATVAAEWVSREPAPASVVVLSTSASGGDCFRVVTDN